MRTVLLSLLVNPPLHQITFPSFYRLICPEEQVVWEENFRFIISCVVYSNPPVDANNVSWVIEGRTFLASQNITHRHWFERLTTDDDDEKLPYAAAAASTAAASGGEAASASGIRANRGGRRDPSSSAADSRRPYSFGSGGAGEEVVNFAFPPFGCRERGLPSKTNKRILLLVVTEELRVVAREGFHLKQMTGPSFLSSGFRRALKEKERQG